jgi:hypothetical protein
MQQGVQDTSSPAPHPRRARTAAEGGRDCSSKRSSPAVGTRHSADGKAVWTDRELRWERPESTDWWTDPQGRRSLSLVREVTRPARVPR